MALGLADFYGGRRSVRPSSFISRDSDASQSLPYRPNESLTHRRDLQVSLSDDEDELDSSCDIPGGIRASGVSSLSFSSTPEANRRYMGLCASSENPSRSRPIVPPDVDVSLQSVQPPALLGMLQEQQCLLQKLLHEQQEITKAVKKNDKQIALMEVVLKQHTESSCSSSSEKRRTVTKDLTVSPTPSYVHVITNSF